MKILVVDDEQIHLDAATKQLCGYDVTLVSSYDEAVALLDHASGETFPGARELYARETNTHPPDRASYSSGDGWLRAALDFDEKMREFIRKKFHFDVFLCDLLMPAGREYVDGQGNPLVGQEMPCGLALALVAAKNGIEYVAVVTDVHPRTHPASAILNRLARAPAFRVNSATVCFFQHYYPKRWDIALRILMRCS